jgi:hypothetical protein
MSDSEKKKILSYSVATLVLGIMLGGWITVNFHKELGLMPSDDVYEFDAKYDKEVSAFNEKYKDR